MNKEADRTKSTIVDVGSTKKNKRKRIKLKKLVYSTDKGSTDKK